MCEKGDKKELKCGFSHPFCSHQYWMGSINLLSFNAQSICCQLTRQHQEEKEKSFLETPRFEPGAAGREASMLSTVLCAPPVSHSFFTCRHWLHVRDHAGVEQQLEPSEGGGQAGDSGSPRFDQKSFVPSSSLIINNRNYGLCPCSDHKLWLQCHSYDSSIISYLL